MNRRTRRTLLIVAGVILLLAVAIFLRSKAPPEAARLLPESDGILYVDIKPMRTFSPKNMKPPTRTPEFQQFVDATGIDWERDLDEVAISLHRMPDPDGPNGPDVYKRQPLILPPSFFATFFTCSLRSCGFAIRAASAADV